MKVLLDTNTYVELMRGDECVASLVRRSERVLISAIVAGELLYGFRHGSRFRKNLDELREMLSSEWVDLVPVTLDSADRYGRVMKGLRDKGRPIPTNDVWIAAHAMETGAELLSFDAHFAAVDGLAWTNPSDTRSTTHGVS
jgi:predicted nucleic acid-binding protein